MLLIVPHRRDPSGLSLPNSEIWNVRIFIEDVPKEARVAGHQHIGQRFPDKELYAVTVSSLDLADRQIDLASLIITKPDGTELDYQDAKDDDIIHYTTGTGIIDTITFLVGADYYDLSDISIDVELLPSDIYNLVYRCNYYRRILSSDGLSDFLCIDSNFQSLAVFTLQIDHPGRVLEEFYRLTPAPYVTSAQKSAESTLALYRPFTDILQDIMDEQGFVSSINWVFNAPPETIPYLSSLLGWDIPYFPESLDQLRRAVLRRTVEFQNLKGSRRAIVNIFRLFGFEILISNLWWSSNGKRLIRPDETLPPTYNGQSITTVGKNQIDSLYADYIVEDFVVAKVPFLYRPQELSGLDTFTALRDGGQITVLGYVVSPTSEAHLILAEISAAIYANPSEYGTTANCVTDANGFLFPEIFDAALAGQELLGFSQIHVAGRLGLATEEILVGPIPPLTRSGISFNREKNELSIVLNGNSQFEGTKVFIFAIYKRYEFNVPDIIKNLQSNRFDIQVLTDSLQEFADPTTLEFAVEFLFRLKAFHSQLNVIRTSVELTEVYNVTDICAGGDFAQRYDTAMGMLQVPPAIIPQVPTEPGACVNFDPKGLGYKDEDIILRLRLLSALPEEHAAWKILDGRLSSNGDSRIAPNQPTEDPCQYTKFGQDRIIIQETEDSRDFIKAPSPNANSSDSGFPTNQLSANDETENGVFASGALESSNSDSHPFSTFLREFTEESTPLCDLDGVTDYCYKGRVRDELLLSPIQVNDEYGGPHPIYLSMGVGVYWLFPVNSTICRPGTQKPTRGSLTQKIRFSGEAPAGNIKYYKSSTISSYLEIDTNQPLAPQNNSFLGRLYRDYHNPGSHTLHFSNRNNEPITNQRYQLAIQRPSLEIVKATMHLPGCRFPRMQAITEDFEHAIYPARPWDFAPCGAKNRCGITDPTYLNFKMITDEEGNETLSFDDQPYQIPGNGLTPDIAGLGSHALTNQDFSDDEVIHKVYMKDASSNLAITLDSVCDYGTSVDDGLLEITDPLFSSHNLCGTDQILKDFADGYPCLSGFQPYTQVDIGTGLYNEVLLGLGIPSLDGTDLPTEALFFLNSGIRNSQERAYRLDAGCSLVDCAISGSQICSTNVFLNGDHYDWEPDHLQLELKLAADESIGVETHLLNGEIGSLLELL